MKTLPTVGLFLVFVSTVATIGIVSGQYSETENRRALSEQETQVETQPDVPVELVPLQVRDVEVTATGFGKVQAMPGESTIYTVPFECRVVCVHGYPGMRVSTGDALVEIEAGPDALFDLERAREELKAATTLLEVVREKVSMKLATQQELLEFTQSVEAAKSRVRNLNERGIGKPSVLLSKSRGVISRVDVQSGAAVPAGDPLIGVIAEDDIVVGLGIENEDSSAALPGCPVRLKKVLGGDGTIDGKVRSVAREVDPETRLVRVYVQPERDAPLFLNEYVQGQIILSTRKGLMAPPLAIIPADAGYTLYTVKDGRAVEHKVTTGLDSGEQVEVIESSLEEGESVVVAGASQLSDGMPVRVKSQE